jgi:hypothetical protein
MPSAESPETHLPTFLGIGAQKAGTTTLFHQLKRHPRIFLPEQKELHFFDDAAEYAKGPGYYARTHFAAAPPDSVRGELTPSYLYVAPAAQRIRDTLGRDVRLIVVLRNPVERAYSHYQQSREKGQELEPWSRALELEASRITQGHLQDMTFSYVNRGLYAAQLRRYRDLFPPEQIRVLVFEEDIARNQEETILQLYSFLGVEPFSVAAHEHGNPRSQRRSLLLDRLLLGRGGIRSLARVLVPSASLRSAAWRVLWRVTTRSEPMRLSVEERREAFERYFAEDVERLEAMLGRDLEVWRSTSRGASG